MLSINTLMLVSSSVHQFPQRLRGSPVTAANVRQKENVQMWREEEDSQQYETLIIKIT